MTDDEKNEKARRRKERERVEKQIAQLTLAYTLSPPMSLKNAICQIAAWQAVAEFGQKTLETLRKKAEK